MVLIYTSSNTLHLSETSDHLLEERSICVETIKKVLLCKADLSSFDIF